MAIYFFLKTHLINLRHLYVDWLASDFLWSSAAKSLNYCFLTKYSRDVSDGNNILNVFTQNVNSET